MGLDPDTFSEVARVHAGNIVHVALNRYGAFALEGGAGSRDDVLAPTPELLVTGNCPGTVYVTAVDATPGQHVQIASATRLGNRVIRTGPCTGLRSGLGNPVPRFDFVASDLGLASTTIQTTAQMCGALHFQALDVDSCQLTSVRDVPLPWGP